MLRFFENSFAIAGVLAAAGPVLIHLLNRRRYRVVEWGAMEFLKQALARNRRVLQLRDMLLLLVRIGCLVLFGLALARPYLSQSAILQGTGGPLHAILILDNSLSMGYETLTGTLLDDAKQKAADFIQQLPPGSQISVIPLCGSSSEYSLDPYRSREDARDALAKIPLVDRAGTAAEAADLAVEACRYSPNLPAKRIVFLGDQQVSNWPQGAVDSQLGTLPEMQVAQVAAEQPENAWVSAFHVQDGIADVESPTIFFATIGYTGPAPRTNVQITLAVDNVVVAGKTIDLEPGQFRELQFPYRFEVPVEAGKPTYVPATVMIQADSIVGDRLRADNRRFLSVPVVAALPVVFVDQYGTQENPQRNQYGETFRLRRLLASATVRGDSGRQLVRIRHTTLDKLERSQLEDARLVVIAGVQSPDAVTLLREYVLQGGRLCIAAGAKFDPQAWTLGAWRDGAGILPAPLLPEAIGELPSEAAAQLEPFQLDFASLLPDYFLLEDSSREDLEDLYLRPLFFKAVAVDVTPQTTSAMLRAETQRLQAEAEFLGAAEQRRRISDAREASQELTDAERLEQRQDEARRVEIAPEWLLWKQDPQAGNREQAVAERAQQTLPRVLARFSKDQLPFLVERKIGAGQVLFVSSGLYSEWNDLTNTNAALVFDRIFRIQLEQTLPQRNLESVQQAVIPVESGDRRIQYLLTRPSGNQESLSVDALGADNYAVTIRNLTDSGHYCVAAYRDESSAAQSGDSKLWEFPLAVNGPPQESQLQTLDEQGFQARVGSEKCRWIGREDPLSLEGAAIRGQDLWKWLMGLSLLGLIAELGVLAWPVTRAKERPA